MQAACRLWAYFFIFGTIFVFPCIPTAFSEVRTYEQSVVIPTYKLGPADKNPIFFHGRSYEGAKGPVYPLPFCDYLTDDKGEASYRMIYLENEYIKVGLMPDIGGRVFSAVDKTNGYDFIYRQTVIKPGRIGMLGAWISGGIEWNYPHHHKRRTFMASDYVRVVDNPDGSKTAWLGEMEYHGRTKILVGTTVFPGKNYFQCETRIFNPTPFENTFLDWANVAVHTNENYQIIFPPSVEYTTFHGKNQFSEWPISHQIFRGFDFTSGVDVSWFRNHAEATSMFAWYPREDFFAGYDHGRKSGIMGIENHHISPGMKFWTWGHGYYADMWENILTDTDGPYIELMCGNYSDNQPDYAWLKPYETKIAVQSWYPIRELAGARNANLDAAVNLDIADGRIKLAFNTTSARKNARVVLTLADKVILEKTIDIAPDKPFVAEVAAQDIQDKYGLGACLYAADGRLLISYSPVRPTHTPMPATVQPPPSPQDINTVEELYLAGSRLEQFHNAARDPYPYYFEALARDPDDSRTNTALGVLYIKRAMFEEAAEHLRRAISRLTRDYTRPENCKANYYLGLALAAQGKYELAYDEFYKAVWDQAFAAAGYHSLAKIDCRRGDFTRALAHLDAGLAANASNIEAMCLKTAVLRRLGDAKSAERLVEQIFQLDPTNLWAYHERHLMAEGAKRKEIEKQMGELTREAVDPYLELAIDYSSAGLYQEAIAAANLPISWGKTAACGSPMFHYHLAHFYFEQGMTDKADEYLASAAAKPSDYCFPFRLESIPALELAMRRNPADWAAPYYLGNLYYDRQPEKAIELWHKSRELKADFPTVHRNLAIAFWNARKDIPAAVASMEKAIECDKSDPRLFFEQDTLYELAGADIRKRLTLLEKNSAVVCKRDYAASRLILCYIIVGRYDDAIKLLAQTHFHQWEGGGYIRNAYVDAYLLRGYQKFARADFGGALEDYLAAFEHPQNLEVAKPRTRPRFAQIFYFIASAYEALGDKEKAKQYYEQTITVSDVRYDPDMELEIKNSEYDFYRVLALGKLGRGGSTEKLSDGLIKQGEEGLAEGGRIDFFAKFAERQSEQQSRSQSHFMMALGYLVKSDRDSAKEHLAKALELNPYHLWAAFWLAQMDGGPLLQSSADSKN